MRSPVFGVSPVVEPTPTTNTAPTSLQSEDTHLSDPSIPLISSFIHSVTQAGLDRLSLDEFELLGPISEGGTFVVTRYSSRIPGIGIVAVKKTKFAIPQGATHDVTLMRRMNSISHEVGILMLPQLQANKYILRLFGWDWFEDWQNENTNRGVSPALIMEYATLGPLNRYLSCRPSTSTEKILWCAQTCTALRSVHECGVVHGDIKPENVLLCQDESGDIVAKLSDFGNALFVESEEGTYTCTPSYAAPEVKAGGYIERTSLKLCDIFSFGLLAWEVLLDGANYHVSTSSCISLDDSQDMETSSVTDTMSLDDSGHGNWDDDVQIQTKCALLKEALKACDSLANQSERTQFKLVFLQTLQENPQVRVPSLEGIEAGLWKGVSRPRQGFPSFLFASSDLIRDSTFPASVSGDIGDALLSLQTRALQVDMFINDLMDSWKPDLQARLMSHVLARVNALDNEDRGRDAFILSRTYSSGFGTTFSHPPDVFNGLKWLEESAKSSYYPALLIGRRIYEANHLPVPEAFSSLVSIDPASCTLRVGEPECFAYLSLLRLYLHWVRENTHGYVQHTPRNESIAIKDEGAILQWIHSNSFNLDSKAFELNLNPQRPSRGGLLHVASALGHATTVEKLLAAGANVNAFDSRRQTPLLLACMHGQANVAKVLLSHGADPALADELGAVPLHWVFSFDQTCMEEIALMLVGNDPTATIHKETTGYYPIEALCLPLCGSPLRWAISVRCVPAVKVLLALGASPYRKLRAYERISSPGTPLQLASGLLFYDMLRALLESGLEGVLEDTSILYCIGRDLEPFQAWIVHGKEYDCEAAIQVIQILQEAGHDVNKIGESALDDTPLQRAAFDGYPEIVRALLACGADVNLQSSSGTSALHVVFEVDCSENNPLQLEILDILLRAGANVNLIDESGSTPLHSAIAYECGDLAAAELLKHNPDLSIKNNDGQTCLHLLAGGSLRFSEATLDLFLQGGAELDLEDNIGRTPLALAALNSSKTLVEWFLAHNATINVSGRSTLLHSMITAGPDYVGYQVEFFDYLLSQPRVRGCVNQGDAKVRTPLHHAALYASPKHLRSLLRAGGDPTLRDEKGMTPIELARDCLENRPHFVVGDDCHKSYVERYETFYMADLVDAIYVLESLETMEVECGGAI